LPISSDGHLTLFEKILDFQAGNLTFNVTLHIGTLLAIIVFYYKDLVQMFHRTFITLAVISSIPTAIIGLGMKKFYDFEHASLIEVAIFFSISGLFLYFADKKMTMGPSTRALDITEVARQIDYKKAFWIGVAQGFAVLPGVSRSGSTIATALMMHVAPPMAAFYSFAISIPAVLGACLLELPEAEIAAADLPLYGVGILVSFIVGLISLRFLRYLFNNRARIILFAYYLWCVAAVMIAYSLFYE